MSDNVWRGPPRVTDREEAEDYKFFLIPMIMGQDFGVQIEGSNELFYPVFSNEQVLNNYMLAVGERLGLPGAWTVQRIEGPAIEALFEIVVEKGFRVMIDPVSVSSHHTKWKERVKVGDLWKYQDFENN